MPDTLKTLQRSPPDQIKAHWVSLGVDEDKEDRWTETIVFALAFYIGAVHALAIYGLVRLI